MSILSKQKDYAFFTRKMFLRVVLPAPFAAIGLSLAEMGDTVLVGHGIGIDGLAAIGYLSPLFLLTSFFVFGLSAGGAIVYSNLMHEGKKDEALRTFNFFLQVSVAIGFAIMAVGFMLEDRALYILGATPEDDVVFAMAKSYLFYILLGSPFQILMQVLTTYLRNDDADNLATSIQTAAGVSNIILSYLLLFHFGWGVAGCSFGYFFTNAVAVLVSLGYILLRKNGNLRLQKETISFRQAIKPLRLGFATSSEYIFDAIFTLAAIHMVTEMAGTEGVAVFNIIENLSLLFIFLFEFIGKTSQPLFSTFFAECNTKELHRVFRYALLYSLFWGALSTALMIVWPQVLNLLFGLEGVSDANQAYYAARVFCIGSLFMGAALLLQNYLQSEEDETGAFLIVFLRRIGTSLPLLFLLAPYGFHAFWLVYPLAEIVTLIILYFYERSKGERQSIDPARVYSAAFLGRLEDVSAQLDAVEAFAARWGAGEQSRYTLRLAMEEICGVMDERARTETEEPLLTQLTLIAQEDGTFTIHLRDNAKEFNPFQLPTNFNLSEPVAAEEEPDLRAMTLRVVKGFSRQYLYRSYRGFNTITITV